MKIQKIKLSELKEAEYNPRIDLKPGDEEFEKIKRSIQEFGFVEPIIVNSDMTIIGGHQRYKVLKELGYDVAECSIVDLDKTKEKALNIALNKISGDWDNKKLEELIAELNETDINMDITGFTFDEVEEMLRKTSNNDYEEDHFDENKALNEIKEPITKKGDVWLLGNHKLMCGDSTDKEDIKKLMGTEVAKCLFTSPPYNMASQMYENYNDNLESKKYIDFNIKTVNAWIEHLKGYLFWNISYNKNSRWEFAEIIYRIIKESGLKFMELIVWDKGHAMPIVSKDMLTRQYEDILLMADEETLSHDMELFYLGTTNQRAYFNKVKGKGITNYWRITTGDTQLDNHKACFPVLLPIKAIELTTNKNDIVIDCFGGSGTTLIACEKLNRRCYMMELDPVYCDIIVGRWKKYTGKKATKI